MSFYVKRFREATAMDPWTGTVASDARIGWTGPIRSEKQAQREVAAWNECAHWSAEIHASSPDVKREVREWQKARDIEHGRR